jgi:hypothetical protein
MDSDLMLLIVVVALALIFDFTNGFHDAANAIATSVSTRALRPRPAVAMAGLLNFAGAFVSLEVAAFSVAFYVGVNEGLYNGYTPYAADIEGETATDASFPLGYLERSYRLVALWIDREYGLLRFAPIFAMAFVGLWLLHRGRRERLARVIPAHARAESAAMLCAGVLAAQVVIAAFLAPTMFGFWFPPRHLIAALPLAIPLVAWGVRHAPRVGALLGAIGAAASVWIYVAVRSGSAAFVTDRPNAPLGPLEDVLPLFDEGSTLPYALAAAIGCALAALLFLDSRHWRQTAGSTRAKYSG